MTFETTAPVKAISSVADLSQGDLVEIATLSNYIASERVKLAEAMTAEVEQIALNAWTTAPMIFEEVYRQVADRHPTAASTLATPAWKELERIHSQKR